MPPLIEIKGLKTMAEDVRTMVRSVKNAGAMVNEEAMALKTTLADAHKQLKDAHDDIRSEFSSLGNGGPTGEEERAQSQTASASFQGDESAAAGR